MIPGSTRRHYEAQGFAKPYAWAHNAEVPFATSAKPISESVLALITDHHREP